MCQNVEQQMMNQIHVFFFLWLLVTEKNSFPSKKISKMSVKDFFSRFSIKFGFLRKNSSRMLSWWLNADTIYDVSLKEILNFIFNPKNISKWDSFWFRFFFSFFFWGWKNTL